MEGYNFGNVVAKLLSYTYLYEVLLMFDDASNGSVDIRITANKFVKKKGFGKTATSVYFLCVYLVIFYFMFLVIIDKMSDK